MKENVSTKFNVLDFIITVLAQHEKSLSESLNRFNEVVNRLENHYDKKTESKVKIHLSSPTTNHQVANGNRLEGNQTRREIMSPNKVRDYDLKQIEVVILNLTLKGNSIENIAERLDVNPYKVKETVEELTSQGFLP